MVHHRRQDIAIVTVLHLDKEEPVWHHFSLRMLEKRFAAVSAFLIQYDLLHHKFSRDGSHHVISIKIYAVSLVEAWDIHDISLIILELLGRWSIGLFAALLVLSCNISQEETTRYDFFYSVHFIQNKL